MILYLASRSPRRRELLEQIGIRYQLLDVEVDESILPGEDPGSHVLRLARAKAETAYAGLPSRTGVAVLAADTVVVVGDEILGKPRDRADGLRMLNQLSGTVHQVYSGIALQAEGQLSRVSITDVAFRELCRSEAEAYWATGEPTDKAGSYAIQGKGAVFIREIRGSYSGVMGLPLYETAELLRAVGMPLP